MRDLKNINRARQENFTDQDTVDNHAVHEELNRESGTVPSLHPVRTMMIQILAVLLVAACLVCIVMNGIPGGKKVASVKEKTGSGELPAVNPEVMIPVTDPESEAVELPVRQIAGPVQNKDLVEAFWLRSIRISRTNPDPASGLFRFRKSVCRYPFAANTFVVYVEAIPGNPEKTEIMLELATVSTEGAAYAKLRNPSTPYAETILLELDAPPLADEVICQALIQIPTLERDIQMPIQGTPVSDFEHASPELRLCTILHACAVPNLIFDDVVRKKITAAAESLLKNEYKGNVMLQKLTDRLQKMNQAGKK